jgi:hypothetical protein
MAADGSMDGLGERTSFCIITPDSYPPRLFIRVSDLQETRVQ